MIRDLKSRLEGSRSQFSNDKNAILQESKIFSKVPISSKKCARLLTRILSLLNCGSERFSESESTDIFFGVTRLFEADDERLRRLIYLLIKCLPVNETEIFIVTSSLTKDMNSQNFVYRANAIRSICYIMRGAVSPQIERYLKSSLVDKQPYVSSSTLLCAIGMFTRNCEMLKRWFSEITTCLSSKSEMVRFHATILLFLLRLNDRQSIRKLVATLEGSGVHVVCFILRFLTANSPFSESQPFALKCLAHESPVVRLEACKSLVSQLASNSSAVSQAEFDLSPVLEALRGLLSVGDVYTFAAMRQISLLARLQPRKLSVFNGQLEGYVASGNRAVSSLALLALLQTGGSDTVENLLAQASGLTGEFKLEVTRAIKRLCVSHPDKFRAVLRFLAQSFRQESQLRSKSEMVEATIFIAREVPRARVLGVGNLCEFTEDCEYAEISARILRFLGENVPKMRNPQDYVRFIYNRLTLESALVRSAGVDALEAIARSLPALRPCIAEMIRGASRDSHFQLREQISASYGLLSGAGLGLEEACEALGEEVYLADLAQRLRDKVQLGLPLTHFSLRKPVEVGAQPERGKEADDSLRLVGEVADLVGEVAEGRAYKLTEDEEDYTVTAQLLLNGRFTVLKFTVENTLSDQFLEQVNVTLDFALCANHRCQLLHSDSVDLIECGEKKVLYSVLERHEGGVEGLLFGAVKVTLNFVLNCSGEKFKDCYKINNLNLDLSSYVTPLSLTGDEFAESWGRLADCEVAETFNLAFGDVERARAEVTSFFGLGVVSHDANNRLLCVSLAGRFLGDLEVLAKASFAQPSEGSCVLRLQLRSQDVLLCKFFAAQLE